MVGASLNLIGIIDMVILLAAGALVVSLVFILCLIYLMDIFD